STTEPTSASNSIGRPASRSCSIEVLCAPTFSAPAIRCSMEIGNSMPNLLDFLHNASNHESGSWIARDLRQRGSSERADWIERSVPQDLYPDLVPDARGHWTTKTRGNERFGEGTDALGARAVRF